MKRALLLLALACNSRSSEPAAGSSSALVEPSRPPPPPTNASTLTPGVELPEVPLVGYAKLDAAPAISISPTAITVRGKQVAALKDGVVDAAQLAPQGRGQIVPALAKALGESVPAPLQLAVDGRVPYQTLHVVLATARATQLQLLARAGGETVASTVELLAVPASDIVVPGKEPPVAISIVGDYFHVRRLSGEPPTKILVAAPTAMKDLGELLARMKQPAPVFVLPGAHTPMQVVAEVLGGVRALPDGKPLFSSVALPLPP